MDVNEVRKRRRERFSKTKSGYNYNPLVQKPTTLQPLGPRGGYHYFGPPPDAGFSYGNFTDSSGYAFIAPKGEQIYSPVSGEVSKFVDDVAYDTFAKLMDGKTAVYTCVACETPILTNADVSELKFCVSCGEGISKTLANTENENKPINNKGDEMKKSIKAQDVAPEVKDEELDLALEEDDDVALEDVMEEPTAQDELEDEELDIDIDLDEETADMIPLQAEEDDDEPTADEMPLQEPVLSDDELEDIEIDIPVEEETEEPADAEKEPEAPVAKVKVKAQEKPVEAPVAEDEKEDEPAEGEDIEDIEIIDDVNVPVAEEDEPAEAPAEKEPEAPVAKVKVKAQEKPVEAPVAEKDEEPAEGEDKPEAPVAEDDKEEPAEGEDKPEVPVAEKEEPAEAVSYETLSSVTAFAGITASDVTMVRFDEMRDNPYYVMLVKGSPVARIELASQPKPEEIRAHFVEDSYAESIKGAVEKVGLVDVLSHVKAKLYVNKIFAGKLALALKRKIKAAARTAIKAKLVGLRKDFLNALDIVLAGTNKNFFEDGHNPLKAAFWSELNELGLGRQANKVVEAAFKKGASPFFKFVTDKACEYMDMNKDSLGEIAKAIGSANIIDVEGSVELEEKPLRAKLQAGNMPLQSGLPLENSSDLKMSFKERLKLNRK